MKTVNEVFCFMLFDWEDNHIYRRFSRTTFATYDKAYEEAIKLLQYDDLKNVEYFTIEKRFNVS